MELDSILIRDRASTIAFCCIRFVNAFIFSKLLTKFDKTDSIQHILKIEKSKSNYGILEIFNKSSISVQNYVKKSNFSHINAPHIFC